MQLQLKLPLERSGMPLSPEQSNSVRLAMDKEHKLRVAIQCHPTNTLEGLMASFVAKCSPNLSDENFLVFLYDTIAEGLRRCRLEQVALDAEVKDFLFRVRGSRAGNY